jgi:Cu(I)/Ag(I) efflux system periplasmic protein CusF
MKRTSVFAVALLSSILAVSLASAQSDGMRGMDMKGMDKGSKKSQSHHAVGTVKSVDAAKGTVTLNHEPVASMNWPAMSMTFKAKDKKMLQHVKPGQKLEIDFQQQGKDHVITKVK